MIICKKCLDDEYGMGVPATGSLVMTCDACGISRACYYVDFGGGLVGTGAFQPIGKNEKGVSEKKSLKDVLEVEVMYNSWAYPFVFRFKHYATREEVEVRADIYGPKIKNRLTGVATRKVESITVTDLLVKKKMSLDSYVNDHRPRIEEGGRIVKHNIDREVRHMIEPLTKRECYSNDDIVLKAEVVFYGNVPSRDIAFSEYASPEKIKESAKDIAKHFYSNNFLINEIRIYDVKQRSSYTFWEYQHSIYDNLNKIRESGVRNVAIGKNAGMNLTTGSNNILIGDNAGRNLTTEDDVVIIGDDILDTRGNSTTYRIGNNIIIGKLLFGRHFNLGQILEEEINNINKK